MSDGTALTCGECGSRMPLPAAAKAVLERDAALARLREARELLSEAADDIAILGRASIAKRIRAFLAETGE